VPQQFVRGSRYNTQTKLFFRPVCRKVGFTRVLHRVRNLWHSSDYEDKFAAAFLSSIRRDESVWDIRTNVGFYMEQLSKLARHVVAFEPLSDNCLQITSRCLAKVDCRQLVLDNTEVQVLISRKRHSVRSLRAPPGTGDTAYEAVSVMRGDALVCSPMPNVVKIDVEGYEPEVINVVPNIFSNVRAAFIEVHFSILESRGMLQQPAAVEQELKRLGSTTVKWVDASHIDALRTL
jgi:FkbM family methyltransferase